MSRVGRTCFSLSVTLVASLVSCAVSHRPVLAGEPGPRFRVSGKELLLDGEPFRIKAVCYQPLLPGQTILSPLDEDQLRRDLAMIARSGANTVRVYPQPLPDEGIPQRFPKSFYDLVRESGLWIVRDVFVDVEANDFFDPRVVDGALESVHIVVDEVFEQGGEDRILAWEVGNEFTPFQVGCTNNPDYGCVPDREGEWPDKPTSFAGAHVTVDDVSLFEVFLAMIANEIKGAVLDDKDSPTTSTLVTWAAWPPVDPIRTDFWFNAPAPASFLDFVSYNAYTYWPDRIRTFNPGAVTGRPYQGYLEFLTSLYPDTPVFVSEVGLPNSSVAVPESQDILVPLDPFYRRGGLTHEQMAQGLENVLLDVYLGEGIIGASIFEWYDEWNKIEDSDDVHDDDPEEYFGLLSFDEGIEGLKPAFDAVRRVFALELSPGKGGPVISSLQAASISLSPGASTEVTASASSPDDQPLSYRWFSSRGAIFGSGAQATFVAPPVSLGPATITLLVSDALGRAAREQVVVTIEPDGDPSLTIDTCGTQRVGGRLRNVDLTDLRLAVYVRTDAFYVQPWGDAPYVEVADNGTWNTFVHNWPSEDIPDDPRPRPIWAVLVPKTTVLLPRVGDLPESPLPAVSQDVNDRDGPVEGGDLLPDEWELAMGLDPTDPGSGIEGAHWPEGPQGDPDDDGLTNYEEFLLGKNAQLADNDDDGDGLEDGWERRYFGNLDLGPEDDPDGDGISNLEELEAITSPVRADHDRDRDGVPDAWELEHFGNLDEASDGDSDGDGLTNLVEYRNLTNPRRADTDGDGMTDPYEVNGKLQPLLEDAEEDPDGDSFSNAFEFDCHGDASHPRNPLAGGPPCLFTRGDANRDGRVDISDAIAILNYLFLGGPMFCVDTADVDDETGTNVTDPIFLLRHLFMGGPPPPPPFPEKGLDPTDDDGLGCGG